MHRITSFAALCLAALSLACGKPAIVMSGHTVFKSAGSEIRYATFTDGGVPEYHAIGALKKMPGADAMELLDVVPLNARDLLALTRSHGLYLLASLGDTCARIDQNLPPEVLYPFKKTGRTKPVQGHAVSPDGRRIAVVMASQIHCSRDGGRTFARLPMTGMHRYMEIISVALHPVNERLILAGTSSNGLFYSRDGGATAVRLKAGMPGEPVRTPNFIEEIRALCFGPDEDSFYAGFGNGCGVYRGSLSRGLVEKLPGSPELYTYPDGDPYRVTSVNYRGGALLIGTNRNRRRLVKADSSARNAPLDKSIAGQFMDSDDVIAAHTGGQHLSFPRQYRVRRAFSPDRRAEGRRAMYISYSFTQRENYPRLIGLLRHLKLNAVVINLKDDYGSIRVPVTDPLVTQVPGAVKPYAGVVETIKKLKADGIFVIARLVCFKDDKLYVYQDHKYAVRHRAGYPYPKGPEKWVDAYSEFVWDYNIAVGRAAERAGADEVQFDYIRFPDVRGDTDNRVFPFQREHQNMREALASFLIKARETVKVPISVDIFGFNGVYQWGEGIGQDIVELAGRVDVLSPMFYPSHYTGGYAGHYGENRRIYYTIYLSCLRARELAGPVIHRPYIQSFYYRNNEDNYCVDYIGWELDGLKKAGLTDFIFWNDLSEYTIFIRGMRKYLGLGEGPVPPEVRAMVPKKLPFDSLLER